MANATIKVSSNTLKMGEECIITIVHDDASSDLYYSLKYKVGSTAITNIKSVDAPGDVAWTPPRELIQYANGQLSVSCTIYCDVYRRKQFASEFVSTTWIEVTLTVPDPSEIYIGDRETWDIGLRMRINTSKIEGYVYDLSYTIGETTNIIATDVDTGAWWEISDEVAVLMPNTARATAVITCTTKLSSSSVVVGSTTKDVIITIPENETTRPAVTMSLLCVNDLPSKFEGIYLSGKSRVEVSYDIDTFYTSVASCETTILGETGQGNPYLSQVLNTTGKAEIRGTVTDARGYKTTVTNNSISVVDYSRPRVAPGNGQSKVICERCDQDGFQDPNGIYLSIKASRKYSKVYVNGSQKNFCVLYYRYKRASDGEEAYSQPAVLLSANESSDNVAVVIPGIVADNKTAYTVQIIAEDDLGEVDLYTVPILTKFVTAHAPVGGHGFTLGGYHDPAKYDVFDCWFDAQFHGDILIGESGMTLRDYILSVINEGG